jgi:NADH-quinone oxidoreductase subunit J
MRPTGEKRLMDAQSILFLIFAGVMLIAALRVITARNPVHAVLFLVLAFFSAAALWILLRAEFLAIALVLVYVGAVMVLFLFVVMMLDINFTELRQGVARYAWIGAVVGLVLVAEIIFVVSSGAMSPAANALAGSPTPAGVSNTEALGNILYTDYFYLFQAAGMVLLIAMIGAIVLTHREREGVKRQRISTQL